MIVLLFMPLLAGLLGLVTAQAADPAEYLERLRFLFLGAAASGFFGVLWFRWRRGRGPLGLFAVLVALVTVRVLYPLILILSVIVTGWVDWAATRMGHGATDGLLHYGLGVFLGAFALVAALIGAAAVASVTTHPKWVVTLVALVGIGAFVFTGPQTSFAPYAKDATTDAIYSSAGPTAWEVARDSERPWRVRTIATCAATFQWALPREGWGGAVRDRLRAYSRGTPEATMADRLLILEFALVRARATLP